MVAEAIAAAQWDLTADVVCIGAGIGGLSAAITAAQNGQEAVVLESTPLIGGVTAVSFGELWVAGNHLAAESGIEDSVDAGRRYIDRLSAGFGDEGAIATFVDQGSHVLRYFAEEIGIPFRLIRNFADYFFPQFEDARAEGRFLEVEPFDAASLGPWQTRTRLSPYVPHGLTHEDMFGAGGPANFLAWDYNLMARRLGSDERCLGPGLAGWFVKAALDRSVPFLTETEASKLVADESGSVIGVEAVRDGRPLRVQARRGVVLATSGYDGNPILERDLSRQQDVGSMLWPQVNGSHIRMAGRLGARVASVPDVSMLGYNIPGEEHEGRKLWRNALTEMGLPHAMVVNRKGRRFGDESFYRSLSFAVDYIDGSDQTQPNFPCWIILDSRSRAKYIFGSLLPGQPFPDGFATSADSIEELAAKTGIDAEGLMNEVSRFNRFCEGGEDADFGRGSKPWSNFLCGDTSNRPNPNLGPIAQPPFHAVHLHRVSGGGISAAGLAIDEHARALTYDDQVIPGLYVAGNAAARLDQGAGMQSGFSNSRGMIHGYLAAMHALRRPDSHEQHRYEEGTTR